jgi:hypothetical protein
MQVYETDSPINNIYMNELRSAMRELERGMDISANLALYIGRGDRIVQIRIDAGIGIYGEKTEVWANLDLGESVFDTWELSMGFRQVSFWGPSEQDFTATWDFAKTPGGYVNTIRALTDWETLAVTLALDIERGRLMRANLSDGIWRAGLDFGTSALGTWRLEVEDSWGDAASLTWAFGATGRGFENTIRLESDYQSLGFGSVWNPENGRFTLYFDERSYDWRWGEWQRQDYSIDGTFIVNRNGGFTLRSERISIGGNETFEIGITLAPGATIPAVNFINMDRWDRALLEMIERSILGMLF